MIKNTWVQVTVKATVNTGLQTPDVFYFGNLAGESNYYGSTGYYVVNALDKSATEGHFTSSATIENLYAHNRDGVVDDTDVAVTTAKRRGTRNLSKAKSRGDAASPVSPTRLPK